MRKNSFFQVLVPLAALLWTSVSAYAEDKSSQQLLDDAKALYEKRDDMAAFDPILGVLEQAVNQAQAEGNDDVKYRALVLWSRSLYWKGVKATGKAKSDFFQKGYEKADEAIKANDFYAEGYYYYGISLGKWGLENFPASVTERKRLFKKMKETRDRETLDGTPGAEIDYRGPDRVEGYAQYRLSSVFLGDKDKALELLKKAHETKDASEHSAGLNSVYYSEVLIRVKKDKREGCKILSDLLSYRGNEAAYNPDRVPETKEDIKAAQELFDDECK